MTVKQHSNEAFVVMDRLNSALTPHVYFQKPEDREILIGAWVAGEHVLVEGETGTGKTTMAKSLAESIGGSAERLQC